VAEERDVQAEVIPGEQEGLPGIADVPLHIREEVLKAVA
jgi:hypothetical protein